MEYSPSSPRYEQSYEPTYSPSNSPRYETAVYSPRWSPGLSPSPPQSPSTTTKHSSSSSILCYSPTQSSIDNREQDYSSSRRRYSPPLPNYTNTITRSTHNSNNYNNRRSGGGKFNSNQHQHYRGRGGGAGYTYTKQHYDRQHQQKGGIPSDHRDYHHSKQAVHRNITQLLMERDFSYQRTVRVYASNLSSSFNSDSNTSSGEKSEYKDNVVGRTETPHTSVSLIGRSGTIGVQCLIPVYDVRYGNVFDQENTNQTRVQLMTPQLLYDIQLHCLSDYRPPRTICVRLIQLNHNDENYTTIGAKQLFSGTFDELTRRFTRENPLSLFLLQKPPELILSMDVDIESSEFTNASITYSVGVAFAQTKIDKWRRDQFIVEHIDPIDQSKMILQ